MNVMTKLNEAEIPISVYKRFGKSPRPIGKPDSGPSAKDWLDRNASSWTTKGLKFSLNLLYGERSRGALLVIGDPGTAKSAVVQEFSRDVAEHEHREYVTFSSFKSKDTNVRLTKDSTAQSDFDNVYANPSKYYVFLDLRASQLQPEQATGIPNVVSGQQKGYLEFMPPNWAHLICNPEFHGFVFLDEINRADPSIINSLFTFVYDRQAAGMAISENVTIAAAANLGAVAAGVVKMDTAFLSRFDVGVLVADPDAWAEWARSIGSEKPRDVVWGDKYKIKRGISEYIIDYVLSNKAENFFGTKVDVEEGNIPLNSRQLEHASIRLQQVEQAYLMAAEADNPIPLPGGFSGNIYEDIGHAIKGRMPNDWTNNFIQWLEIVHSFDWAEIVDTAKAGGYKAKAGARATHEITGSKKWALTRYITNEVMRRFDVARQHGDEVEMKKQLSVLYTDLYHILSGIDADNVSFVLKNLISKIKHNPPPGVTPLQAVTNWNSIIVPLATKAAKDNPEFHKKLKDLADGLGKIK